MKPLAAGPEGTCCTSTLEMKCATCTTFHLLVGVVGRKLGEGFLRSASHVFQAEFPIRNFDDPFEHITCASCGTS